MRSKRIHQAVIIVSLLCTPANRLGAQPQPPIDVSTATAEELITEAARLRQAGEMNDDIEEAIAQRAVVLLSQADLTDPSLNSTWSKLTKLAKPGLDSLPDVTRQQLAERLAAAPFSVANASYDAINARIVLLLATGTSRDSTRPVVEEWIQVHGLDNLSIEMSRFCLEHVLPQNANRTEFSAVWTGQITAPSSGQFMFSVSPINVNKNVRSEVIRHTMTVAINGQQIVSATGAQWQWQGAPVQLVAGQPVPIRVELSYWASVPTYGDSPHALLYWEGPGLARQIVPQNVLSPPDGQGAGLRAEYRWTESGQPHQSTLVDRNIEFAWASCRDVAPPNPALVAALTDRIWQLGTDPAYIAQLAGPAEQLPSHLHVYFRNYFSTEFLSCARRRQFMELLQQTPALLGRADETQILRLYETLRFGSEDGALNMLGTWMQLHSDQEPLITDEFFDRNRRFYRTIALYLAWRSPNQYLELQNGFLRMPDGRCCLPATYTLAYCYLTTGQLDNWREFLNTTLADEANTGDRRVNWLLARAMIEELHNSPTGREVMVKASPPVTSEWLDEAALVAESPGTVLRVRKERIARMAGLQQWETAEDEIAHTANAPAKWGETIAQLKAQADRRAEQQRLNAQNSYVAELKKRRQQAADRGDTSAEGRLGQLISEFESAGSAPQQ